MVRKLKSGVMLLMSVALMCGILSMNVKASTGTFGDNDGFSYSYDATTKTLTVTGEDSGMGDGFTMGPLWYITTVLGDVEKMIFKDCVVSGSLAYAFSEISSVQSIEFINFDTTQVTDMNHMFLECEALKSLDLSEFNTANVTDMSLMFAGCSSLSDVDLSSFNTKRVTKMSSMFDGCNSLESIDVSNFDTANVTLMQGMFSGCHKLENIDVSNFDTNKVTNMSYMFDSCLVLKSLDLSEFSTNNVTNMSRMFLSCYRLENIDLTSFNTENVTDMGYMFYNCQSMKNLNVDNFDTENVTDMSYMFSGCSGLESIDVSNFDTSNVTNMGGMFGGCSSLKSLDVDNFDTSSVSNMSGLFGGCSGVENLKVDNFNTSNVVNISGMFAECSSLTSLDLSNFDTSRVTNMSTMFIRCTALENLDICDFNTENVTTMASMFYGCKMLKRVDLSRFDTSKVTSMISMFEGCSSLKRLDLSSFDTSKLKFTVYFLKNCNNIQILHTPKTMASEQMFELPITFYDLDNNAVTELTEEYTNTMLVANLWESGSRTIAIVTEGNEKMEKNDTLQLLVSVDGDVMPISYNKDYTWSVADESIVSVSADGLITALSSGKTTVTCVHKADELETATFLGNVLYETRAIEILSEDAQVIVRGNTQQMYIALDGETQDVSLNTDYIWTVDREGVVSVSESGLVSGVGVGAATITCIHKENDQETASFTIESIIPYTDIKLTDWQYPFVIYAYENNLMTGKGNGIFDMNNTLRRAEFITILYSYSGKPEVNYEQYFKDVKNTDWFANAVTWAMQENITAGNADGTFGVSDDITREQLVVMMYQHAKKTGVASGEVQGDLSVYLDEEKVSSWAKDALSWAVEKGIMTGKNTDAGNYLDPKGSTTRGECATMVMRYVELSK